MIDTLRPSSVEELVAIIAKSASDGTRLRLRGGDSKAPIGAPTPLVQSLDLRALEGVVDYDPQELVLVARAGTRLKDIQDLLAGHGQMLAFEPFDHGPLFGRETGAATIGGVIAAGVSGPGRLVAGAARDHLLGFEAVSGRGDVFKAGSRTFKNVTGFDLSKVIAGSWGRLAAMTELTLKVMPKPEAQVTLLLRGLGPDTAVAAMSRALGSTAGIAAAAHLPCWRSEKSTVFRLDGFPASIAARVETLNAAMAPLGSPEQVTREEGARLWDEICQVRAIENHRPLWRFIIAPSKAPGLVAALKDADWFFDWAGGLVWVASDADPAVLRSAAIAAGGHATLIRADAAIRAVVPAFHPPLTGIAALESNIRRAFDPAGVFDTGRF